MSFTCTGCGRMTDDPEKDLEALRDGGKISCCPERHMVELIGRVEVDGEFGVIRIPLSELHGLRVSLEPCPCKAPKAHATARIRQRLINGLAKLEALSGR